MKTRFLILTTIVLSLLFTHKKVNAAACTFTSPLVQLLSTQTVTINNVQYCKSVIDLSVDIDINSGNKWTYIHLWKLGDYPNLTYPNPSSAPTAGDLANALFTIVLDNTNAGNPVLSATYPPDSDPNIKVLDATDGLSYTKTLISGTVYRFTFKNIEILIPGACDAGNPPVFKGDSWSSQSDNGKTVQCATTGITITASDPTVTGTIDCGTTNILNFAVAVNGLGTTISFQFDVYVETSGNTQLDLGTDQKIYTGATTYNVTQGSNSPMNFSSLTMPAIYPAPYSNSNPYHDKVVYIVLKNMQISNGGGQPTPITTALVTPIVNTCIPLPSAFENISVSTKSGKLVVNWRTLTEKNNKEFIVEGSKDGQNWTAIGKLDSKAMNGNSDLPIDYSLALNIPVSLAAIGLGGLFLLTLVRSRWARALALVVIVVAVGACLKDGSTVEAEKGDIAYVRVAQHTQDGGVSYSKVIKVVND